MDLVLLVVRVIRFACGSWFHGFHSTVCLWAACVWCNTLGGGEMSHLSSASLTVHLLLISVKLRSVNARTGKFHDCSYFPQLML